MTYFTGTLGIIFIFGAIIAIHELGHFIVAKLSKMEVFEYSLGLGPVLLKRVWRGTQYSLRLIPVGGFVRIAGMELGEEDSPNGYDKKPFFAKFATLIAGAGMNFVLAFVLIIFLGMVIGRLQPGDKVFIAGVVPNTPAARADMRSGDELLQVNDVKNPSIDQARSIISKSSTPVTIILLRDGKQITVRPKPKEMPMPERKDGEFLYSMTTGHLIGVQFGTSSGEWQTYGFVDSLKSGIYEVTGGIVEATAQFASLVRGRIPISQMSGPVGIMNASYTMTKSDSVSRMWFFRVFNLLTVLSLFIGFFNLLPLPALDGGRIAFLFVEGIRGKPLDREKEAMIHAIGLVVLLCFIAFITILDIGKIFGGK